MLTDDLVLLIFLQHKDAYQVILDGVKGGPKEKRLAAQFIPKFFSSFPDMADVAINAQLDLCEDEDVSVSVDVERPQEALFRSPPNGRLLLRFLARFDGRPLRSSHDLPQATTS